MELNETGGEGIDWIRLAQNVDQWQAPVKGEMKLQVL
jgi:hypothetical protein